ncbi:MAG: hypothetical protein CVT92_06715 [Bacteroidetes bacterium HGW-Bacteroidetes-1]|jgi:hypothetical protein|nr:MAG: hypothetical protein CVT92_06715 [Bacteroidetes bacterium HGW-Bacteroidetes-1]
MLNKNLVYILLVVLTLIAGSYFLLYESGPEKIIYDAMPLSSVLIFESNQTGPFWNKIKKETAFWKSVLEIDFIETLNTQIFTLDSLLMHKDMSFYATMKERKMAIALHPVGEAHGYLFFAEVGKNLRLYEIPEMAEKAFGNRVGVIDRKIGDYRAATLIDKHRNIQFNYCIVDGLFIGSFERELLEMAIAQLDSKVTLLQNEDFVSVRETRGKLVDGYVYFFPEGFNTLINKNVEPSYLQAALDASRKSTKWMALDLFIKQNEILLNGFTLPADEGLLNALVGQNSVGLKLLNVLPYNTNLLLHFGLSDFTKFHLQIVDQKVVELWSTRFGIDFSKGLIQQIDNEVALALRSSSGSGDALFAAHLKDVKLVQSTLNALAAATKGFVGKTENNISFANIQGFIPALFGSQFTDIQGCYFTVTDNFLLVANNASIVEDAVRLYKTGRTLDLNENFRRFANNLSDQSNILIYGNIREGFDLLCRFTDGRLLYHLNRNQKVIREFEAFAVQLSATEKMIYTNAVIKYNPDYKEESLIAWKTLLDAPLVARPFIVDDHLSGKKNVIVFDENNKMYLISAEGEVLWKKQLSEQPISDVFVVDFFKNGKLQYLFNTAHHLHLIDRNGDYVRNYPIKLRSQATNGLVVFDYENKKEYRILVSGADKKTYNYELAGREVSGWEPPRSLDIVTKPVERLFAGSLDYIIITDSKGDIKIVDRRGQTRVNPRGQMQKALNSDFYINRTNSKGVLLTTNKNGKLIYISGTGILSTTDFGNYSSDHFFLYEDFTQNRSLDFIFLDGDQLRIYDRFQKELYSYRFKNYILTRPVFFNINRNKRLLGIVDETAREIYLIDKDGKMIIGSGLTGELPFAVGSLRSNDEINLLTAIANELINYQIY